MLVALVQQYVGKDSEPSTSLLMHLVARVSETNSDTASERTTLRYRILANIFNVLPPTSALRLDVFNALLALVDMNGDVDFLNAALKSLPTWLVSWDVTPEQKNACLGKVAAALQSPECGPEWVTKAYDFALLRLRYISSETAIPEEERKRVAESTIADVLRLPKLFEMEEMLHIPAMLALEGQPIFALLKIFVAGTHKELREWANGAGKDTLSRLSLDIDALDRKMRLLDLASLCAGSVSSEVSYDEIAKTLDVPVSEVESWVIDVIHAGVVSGKLSQVKQSFRVYRSTHRTFEKPQWEALEQRLSQWQKSIQSLIATIQCTYATTHTASGGQTPTPSALADIETPAPEDAPAPETAAA